MYMQEMSVGQIDRTFFEFMVELDAKVDFIDDKSWKAALIADRSKDTNPIQACEPSVTMKILVPDDKPADWINTVEGTVFPSGAAVQTLVYSRDRRRHPQRPVTIDAFKWNGLCQLGLERDVTDWEYQIVAIEGDSIDAPIDELPPDRARSEIIHIRRDGAHFK